MKFLLVAFISVVTFGLVCCGCPFANFKDLLGLDSDFHRHLTDATYGTAAIRPTKKPSPSPTRRPTQPSSAPTLRPTTRSPTRTPSKAPTIRPSKTPSFTPTSRPTTSMPSKQPSKSPTLIPANPPTIIPTSRPTPSPTPTSYTSFTGPVCTSGPVSTDMCTLATAIKAKFNALISDSSVDLVNLYGASLRLAFHDAGEIDITSDDLLGSDGCLAGNPNSGNAGLVESDEEVTMYLEPIYQQFCSGISRADFWALWGKFVAEKSAASAINIDFYYGRVDNSECESGSGRLPDALLGLDHIQQVFVNQMGLTLTEAVTLIGAHSVGHMSPSRSGFGLGNGDPAVWDTTPAVLDNRFYAELLGVPWVLNAATSAVKQEYKGPVPRVMLNTDMSLAFVIDSVDDSTFTPNVAVCGGAPPPRRRLQGGGGGGGGPPPAPPCTATSTQNQVISYVGQNGLTKFLNDFAAAYTRMVNVGYSYDSNFGKLGNLTQLTSCPGIV